MYHIKSKTGLLKKRLSALIVMYIIIISGITLLTTTPQKASATVVDIHIDLDDAVAVAKVGPGNSGIATMHGKVVIKKWPVAHAQRISVSVTVDGNGWAASVSPPIMTFTQTDRAPKDITVFILAPQISNFQESKRITVSGSWTAFPSSGAVLGSGEVRGDDLLVVVDQYYYTLLDSADPFKSVWPGQPAEFELIVENRGNGQDDFLIEINNYKGLAEAGWAVDIEQSSVTIGANNLTKVRIIVYPPYNNNLWANYVMEIPIVVTSKGSVQSGSVDQQQYSFFCRQYGIDLDPIPAAIIIVIIVAAVLIIRWARDNFYI